MSSQYTFTPTGNEQISQANTVGFIRPCTYINNALISTINDQFQVQDLLWIPRHITTLFQQYLYKTSSKIPTTSTTSSSKFPKSPQHPHQNSQNLHNILLYTSTLTSQPLATTFYFFSLVCNTKLHLFSLTTQAI